VKRAKWQSPRQPPVAPKPRNPVARSPLLAKGGAHGKTTRAKRREANMELRKLIRDPDGEG
jgi:hypothetical protein